MFVLKSSAATSGLSMGTAFVLKRGEGGTSVPGKAKLSSDQEVTRFKKALETATAELKALSGAAETAKENTGRTTNEIFAAHLEMAQDPELYEQVTMHITQEGKSAQEALDEACTEICSMFEQIEDEYLRARAADVKDVCNRIGRCLRGDISNPFASLPPFTIVVAEELLPSDTAQMNFSNVCGLVTEKGSKTSHVCIIAHSKGIPAIVGIEGCTQKIATGDKLLLNGEIGEVTVDPDEETESNFIALMHIQIDLEDKLTRAATSPAHNATGRTFPVYANAGNIEEVQQAIENGADGIGLLRSEFLYLQEDHLPDEATQFEAYSQAALICGSKPLTIRTLDIGGDKALPYMNLPREDNPFLGMRAIRISLSDKKMFRTQIRAILRASIYGHIRMMFPMISTEDELIAARALVEDCMHEMDSEGIAFDHEIPVGIMVETPAAVFISDVLAKKADFFSIGTNDLTQYVMAVDRGNPHLAYLYNSFDPAVVRAIAIVIDSAHKVEKKTPNAGVQKGIPVGMCGEMASDPQATELLLNLGLDQFSVGGASVGIIKEKITTL